MEGAALAAIGSSVAFAFAAALVHPSAAVLIPLVLLAPIGLSLASTQVEVGTDGVLVRWLGTRRFVRHADIADIKSTALHRQTWSDTVTLVTLTTHAGHRLAIPVPGQGSDEADVMCSRINDARNAWVSGNASPPMPLLRGERNHGLWVAALRKQEAADLRSTAVPKAELWRVVEDVGSAPLERAAAALALGCELSDADRERLTQAAKATVAPKLRVVLERASVAEDDELVTRLRALEQER